MVGQRGSPLCRSARRVERADFLVDNRSWPTPTYGPSRGKERTVEPVHADLVRTLKQLKLGQVTHAVPERPVLARQQKMSHATFQ